jgi:hypothetical protein
MEKPLLYARTYICSFTFKQSVEILFTCSWHSLYQAAILLTPACHCMHVFTNGSLLIPLSQDTITSFTDLLGQGCQMVSFQTKNPNFGNFWRALAWKMLIKFMAIWNIFIDIWDIL